MKYTYEFKIRTTFLKENSRNLFTNNDHFVIY